MASFVMATKSVSWKGSAIAGSLSVSVSEENAKTADTSDGAAYEKAPASGAVRVRISVTFQYMDTAAAIAIRDNGALIVVGKNGKSSGSDVTITAGACEVESKTVASGTCTVVFYAYSSNGTDHPIVYS